MRSKVSSHLATREESQYIHKMLYHCPKFDQKGYFRSKTRKLSITIEFTRLETVYGELFNLNFWTKFAAKEPLWSEKEEVSITIKILIFKLV